MTHDELLAICDNYSFKNSAEPVKALRAVVELHKPVFAIANGVEGPKYCQRCAEGRGYAKYPCPTIKAIEKELS